MSKLLHVAALSLRIARSHRVVDSPSRAPTLTGGRRVDSGRSAARSPQAWRNTPRSRQCEQSRACAHHVAPHREPRPPGATNERRLQLRVERNAPGNEEGQRSPSLARRLLGRIVRAQRDRAARRVHRAAAPTPLSPFPPGNRGCTTTDTRVTAGKVGLRNVVGVGPCSRDRHAWSHNWTGDQHSGARSRAQGMVVDVLPTPT